MKKLGRKEGLNLSVEAQHSFMDGAIGAVAVRSETGMWNGRPVMDVELPERKWARTLTEDISRIALDAYIADPSEVNRARYIEASNNWAAEVAAAEEQERGITKPPIESQTSDHELFEVPDVVPGEWSREPWADAHASGQQVDTEPFEVPDTVPTEWTTDHSRWSQEPWHPVEPAPYSAANEVELTGVIGGSYDQPHQ